MEILEFHHVSCEIDAKYFLYKIYISPDQLRLWVVNFQFGNADMDQTHLTGEISWRLMSPNQWKNIGEEDEQRTWWQHLYVQDKNNKTNLKHFWWSKFLHLCWSWAGPESLQMVELGMKLPAPLHGMIVLLLSLGSLVPSFLGGLLAQQYLQLIGRLTSYSNLMDSHHSSGLTQASS